MNFRRKDIPVSSFDKREAVEARGGLRAFAVYALPGQPIGYQQTMDGNAIVHVVAVPDGLAGFWARAKICFYGRRDARPARREEGE